MFVFYPFGSKNTSASSTPCNPLNESERKDFLSVMVEFVKFHLSRSRKITFAKQDPPPKSFKGPQTPSDASKAIIRFSSKAFRVVAFVLWRPFICQVYLRLPLPPPAIIDIGAAHFKYDMRHITEILAFPRAWYRRTLVRRLFLGDMTSRSKGFYESADPGPASADQNAFPHTSKKYSRFVLLLGAPGSDRSGSLFN